MKTTRQDRALRTLRRPPGLEVISVVALLSLLAALEMTGRELPAEWSVIPTALVIASAIATLGHLSRGGVLSWPSRALARFTNRVRPQVQRVRDALIHGGADLRGTPILERSLPGVLLFLAPLPWVAAGLVLATGQLPHELILGAANHAYLVHTSALLVLWTIGLGLTLSFALLTLGALHDLAFEPRRRKGTMQPEREYALQTTIAITVTAIGFSVPPVILAGLAGIALAAACLGLARPFGPDLDLAWSTNRDHRIRVCSFLGALALRLILWSGLGVFALVCLLGPRLLADTPDSTALPLTVGLGRVLSGWAAAAALTSAGLVIRELTRPRFHFARAARAELTLRLAQVPDPRTATQLENGLRGTGFAIRYGRTDRRAGDVRVPLRSALRLSFAASGGRFEESDVLTLRADLARASERVHRRCLTFGLGKLFECAEAERPPRSEGLWIGPQHWFERAVTAPVTGDTNGARCFDSDVGAPFDEHLDWRTRIYWRGLCRRLEIDHIFVENGLKRSDLVALLELLFEVDDVFGGLGRLEERHLRTLESTRAVIHDFPSGGHDREGDYPEPKYREISRARVLHLFRDRGGDVDWLSPSSPRRSQPLTPSTF